MKVHLHHFFKRKTLVFFLGGRGCGEVRGSLAPVRAGGWRGREGGAGKGGGRSLEGGGKGGQGQGQGQNDHSLGWGGGGWGAGPLVLGRGRDLRCFFGGSLVRVGG